MVLRAERESRLRFITTVLAGTLGGATVHWIACRRSTMERAVSKCYAAFSINLSLQILCGLLLPPIDLVYGPSGLIRFLRWFRLLPTSALAVVAEGVL